MKDFTTEVYDQFLKKAILQPYRFVSINDYMLHAQSSSERLIALRHDVDRNPVNALQLAKIEAAHGISATYYFRMKPASYDISIANEIESLGHEIGYHYETLSDTHGNFEKAWELFQLNLSTMRKTHRVSTVSMHGRPLSAYDNQTLLGKYNYHALNLTGDAILDIDWTQAIYLCDTGRSWGNEHNLRDYATNLSIDQNILPEHTSTILEKCAPLEKNIVISTHPERWSDSIPAYYVSLCKDSLTNLAKLIIKNTRK